MKSTKQNPSIQITRLFTVYSGILSSQSHVTQVATRPRRKWVVKLKWPDQCQVDQAPKIITRCIFEKKLVNSTQNFSDFLICLQMDISLFLNVDMNSQQLLCLSFAYSKQLGFKTSN